MKVTVLSTMLVGNSGRNGIEAVFRLRQSLGLARRNALVGAVNSSFTLGKGIESPPLAR